MNSTASIALSGISAAEVRLGASAHNVANLLTKDFRPLRSHQTAVAQGGTRAQVEQAPAPETVDLAGELVNQMTASLQARASMRVLGTDLGLIGSLLDLFA
ncbi:MAG: flagellar basal body rod protein [Myxococcota bacterium]